CFHTCRASIFLVFMIFILAGIGNSTEKKSDKDETQESPRSDHGGHEERGGGLKPSIRENDRDAPTALGSGGLPCPALTRWARVVNAPLALWKRQGTSCP